MTSMNNSYSIQREEKKWTKPQKSIIITISFFFKKNAMIFLTQNRQKNKNISPGKENIIVIMIYDDDDSSLQRIHA